MDERRSARHFLKTAQHPTINDDALAISQKYWNSNSASLLLRWEPLAFAVQWDIYVELMRGLAAHDSIIKISIPTAPARGCTVALPSIHHPSSIPFRKSTSIPSPEDGELSRLFMGG